MIGDPSGRSKTRPSLTLEETRRNGQTYFEQATRILSAQRISMFYNSEWLGKMTFGDVVLLASKYTVARMLERDDFTQRYKAGEPISVHEMLYPLAQAMDSVAIKADVELGGTDQKFNLLVGREIQREYGLEPQITLMMPILPGTDGVEKMSKSLDNSIGINEPPREIYGKSMRIPDPLIYAYFELTTDVSNKDLREIKNQLESKDTNPRDLKRRLARSLVTLYHNSETAQKAEEEFDRIFVAKTLPDEVEEFKIKPGNGVSSIALLLTATHLATSKSEARRLVEQGGVSIDGEKISDVNAPIPRKKEFVLKVGKRRFLKVLQA
jgi:tyrosyl-tRNA synthetase